MKGEKAAALKVRGVYWKLNSEYCRDFFWFSLIWVVRAALQRNGEMFYVYEFWRGHHWILQLVLCHWELHSEVLFHSSRPRFVLWILDWVVGLGRGHLVFEHFVFKCFLKVCFSRVWGYAEPVLLKTSVLSLTGKCLYGIVSCFVGWAFARIYRRQPHPESLHLCVTSHFVLPCLSSSSNREHNHLPPEWVHKQKRMDIHLTFQWSSSSFARFLKAASTELGSCNCVSGRV